MAPRVSVMWAVAVAAVALAGVCSAATPPTPLWGGTSAPGAPFEWQAEINATSTGWTSSYGIMYKYKVLSYSPLRIAERLDNSAGQDDFLCRSIKNQPAGRECTFLNAADGWSYAMYPKTDTQAAYCCNCSGNFALSPNWLAGGKYVGTVKVNGQAGYEWTKSGSQPNNYAASVEPDRRPLRFWTLDAKTGALEQDWIFNRWDPNTGADNSWMNPPATAFCGNTQCDSDVCAYLRTQ